jgi:hypothetical protein
VVLQRWVHDLMGQSPGNLGRAKVSTNCGLKYKETPSVAIVAMEEHARAPRRNSSVPKKG